MVLGDNYRREFLAVPQLIRLDAVNQENALRPTLLLKSNTLLLKYILLGVRMQLAFVICNGRLLYALRVFDNENKGGVLWSIAQNQKELKAIVSITQGKKIDVFLFNELALNVSWATVPLSGVLSSLKTMTHQVKYGHYSAETMSPAVAKLLKSLHEETNTEWITFEIGGKHDWKRLRNHMITESASSSLIDLFDEDEGNQQEQIGIWLTDGLNPLGVWHTPQRPYKDGQTRELTDILMSYENGPVLIESKALAILTRASLPNREKLARKISKHISKAFGQLEGGIKKLKNGTKITDIDGNILKIPREKPAHAIVLIPDLDLIEDREKYGLEFIKNFMEKTGAFPHILDISELLRVVQSAEKIAKSGTTTTPMMAFDYYLMERIK